jgi:HEPN domain-containing protein
MNEPSDKALDPREWLRRARSNLERAAVRTPHSCLEDLCFDAQQAAEKAVKGVLVARGISFPYVHNLGRLVKLLRDRGEPVPDSVREAKRLTVFAVTSRYPGIAKEATDEQHREALAIAEAVVRWAEESILGEGGQGA